MKLRNRCNYLPTSKSQNSPLNILPIIEFNKLTLHEKISFTGFWAKTFPLILLTYRALHFFTGQGKNPKLRVSHIRMMGYYRLG